jgi:hypothetical protein
MTYEDVNDDWRISPTEASMGGDARFVGFPFPEYEAALQLTLGIGSGVRLSGVLDRRHGQEMLNWTRAVRCSMLDCQDQHDWLTPLDDQARAMLVRQGGHAYNYVRGRELHQASGGASRSGASRPLGGSRRCEPCSYYSHGRNLYTWTFVLGPRSGSSGRIATASRSATTSTTHPFAPSQPVSTYHGDHACGDTRRRDR